MKQLYKREDYLQKIRPFYKSDLIKVLTGIRRCGKSCLLETIVSELKVMGIPEKDIIYLNLDKRGYTNIRTPQQLAELIDPQIDGNEEKYLFIDEVQNVDGFEILINSYRENGNISIFLTGSNSYLLSGELVTKLTGRYVEFKIFPLSFLEYLEMKRFLKKEVGRPLEEFTNYIQTGGFPQSLEFDDMVAKQFYISNVLEQIEKKDVCKKNKIRNKVAFERVKTYIINNFGTTTSLDNIVEYMNNTRQTAVKKQTLKHYLELLENARIIHKCERFDLKSRKSLASGEKYYLADTGIYFASNTDQRINYGPILENILYIYLLNKGYKVSVGRIGKLECDFIAVKNNDYFYIQVAMTIGDSLKTEEREYLPLESIRDNYPKYLFTLDTLLQRRNGIKHLNLIDFIAEGKELS